MIDRRKFLQYTGLAGLSLTAFGVRKKRAWALDPYQGSLWVHVVAQGGWDPRFTFDPIINEEQNRTYTEIRQVGNISYAPFSVIEAIDEPRLCEASFQACSGCDTHLMTNEEFLLKYGDRLTVINGIDVGTTNHDAGLIAMATGMRIPGYPSFPALIATVKAPEQTLAFMSGGGYQATNGHIPYTRIDNMTHLQSVIHPNLIRSNETALYHTDDTLQRIRGAQNERLARMRSEQHTPRAQFAMDSLAGVRVNDFDLADLQLPEPVVLPGNLGDLEEFMQQVQVAVTAFKQGMCVSANLMLSGFDSHNNSDRGQMRQLVKLWAGIDFLMQEAELAGISDRMNVIVTSDFGREPYQEGDLTECAAKHHWPIGTMLAMGPGIPGNRVIGATDERQLPLRINPSTLEAIEGPDGVLLDAAIVNQALRRKANIADHPLMAEYPLDSEDLPLFD